MHIAMLSHSLLFKAFISSAPQELRTRLLFRIAFLPQDYHHLFAFLQSNRVNGSTVGTRQRQLLS